MKMHHYARLCEEIENRPGPKPRRYWRYLAKEDFYVTQVTDGLIKWAVNISSFTSRSKAAGWRTKKDLPGSSGPVSDSPWTKAARAGHLNGVPLLGREDEAECVQRITVSASGPIFRKLLIAPQMVLPQKVSTARFVVLLLVIFLAWAHGNDVANGSVIQGRAAARFLLYGTIGEGRV